MIQAISTATVELVPQAIVNRPVRQVIGQRATVIREADDLDWYEGASFMLNSGLEIAVRHYRGYPPDTTGIYIDRKVNDIQEITKLIRMILKEFDLSEDVLNWERADNPDL